MTSSLLFFFRDSARKEILLFLVSFCPPKSIMNSFSHIQFFRHLLDILL